MARRKERREFFRRDCLMLCRCEAKGFQPQGHIIDVSYGGAGIVGTKQLPAAGAELLVKILLPGSTIELLARVVRLGSKAEKRGLADFAVEFLNSLEERQSKLARFIPQHNAVEN